MELIAGAAHDPISMETLATHLGCSLMALYRCVPSRSAVLDGVARAALTAVPAEAPGAGTPWADQVTAQVRALRQSAAARRGGVILAAGRPPGPPPPGWPLECALGALRASGLSDADTVRVARVLGWYLFGSLLARPDDEADADFDFGLTLVLGGTAALLASG
jgi:hypothetical protein